MNFCCASRTQQRLSFPAVTVKSVHQIQLLLVRNIFIGHISFFGLGFRLNRVDPYRRRSQKTCVTVILLLFLISAPWGKGKQGFDPFSFSGFFFDGHSVVRRLRRSA